MGFYITHNFGCLGRKLPPQHQFWGERRRLSPGCEVVDEREEAAVGGNFAFLLGEG